MPLQNELGMVGWKEHWIKMKKHGTQEMDFSVEALNVWCNIKWEKEMECHVYPSIWFILHTLASLWVLCTEALRVKSLIYKQK